MSTVKELIKGLINGAAGLFGARVVGKHWGPRGVFEALKRAQAAGARIGQIVDAGASDGIWTREALRHFPQARVFLVDALEKNRAPLEALKKEHPNCDAWIGALGPTNGRAEIFEMGDQSSFLKSDSFPTQRKLNVDVQPLDFFLESGRIQQPDLIKADVQGFELEVLKGAARCLEKTELLLLEVSFRRMYDGAPLAPDVFGWVGAKGFRIYDICTYTQRPRDNELAHSDVLFAASWSKVFAYEGWA